MRKYLISLAAVICLFPCVNVCAATTGGFSIRAVIPENQVDKRQTYFDLRMKPGDKQTVELVITNNKTEALTVQTSLNPASTGRNGLIVYTEPDIRDAVMKTAVTDVAVLDKEQVTIPAQSSETVKINITMPDEPFDGLILGGIAVTGIEPESEEKAGVSLNNSFTYVTALKLTENDAEVQPDFELTSIAPSLMNYRTAVSVTLQNKAPRIVKDMAVNAQVFKKGSDDVLRELALPDAEMAPLSSGEFVIDWQNNPLERGDYRLKITAAYNDKTWEWDEMFTIDGNADEVNNNAVGLKQSHMWIYIGVVALAALLTLVWFAAYRAGKRRSTD